MIRHVRLLVSSVTLVRAAGRRTPRPKCMCPSGNYQGSGFRSRSIKWRWPIAQSITRRDSREATAKDRCRTGTGWSPGDFLADEPTGNLDSKNGEAVMDLLRELHQEGATICMVTHDPRFARHAGRSVHLFDGSVVDERKMVAGETSR